MSSRHEHLFVYDPDMEPAHHRLTAPDDPDLLARVERHLAQQGSPPVTLHKQVVWDFECATGASCCVPAWLTH